MKQADAWRELTSGGERHSAWVDGRVCSSDKAGKERDGDGGLGEHVDYGLMRGFGELKINRVTQLMIPDKDEDDEQRGSCDWK